MVLVFGCVGVPDSKLVDDVVRLIHRKRMGVEIKKERMDWVGRFRGGRRRVIEESEAALMRLRGKVGRGRLTREVLAIETRVAGGRLRWRRVLW